jgi:hypothetical protein
MVILVAPSVHASSPSNATKSRFGRLVLVYQTPQRSCLIFFLQVHNLGEEGQNLSRDLLDAPLSGLTVISTATTFVYCTGLESDVYRHASYLRMAGLFYLSTDRSQPPGVFRPHNLITQ